MLVGFVYRVRTTLRLLGFCWYYCSNLLIIKVLVALVQTIISKRCRASFKADAKILITDSSDRFVHACTVYGHQQQALVGTTRRSYYSSQFIDPINALFTKPSKLGKYCSLMCSEPKKKRKVSDPSVPPSITYVLLAEGQRCRRSPHVGSSRPAAVRRISAKRSDVVRAYKVMCVASRLNMRQHIRGFYVARC